MPSMSLAMERLQAGEKTRRQRSTVNHVFIVAEGRGETIINGERFAWQSGDTVAIPMWNKYEHEAVTDSMLFDLSDESLMRMLNHYRLEAD
jgi:gentisate 1,2-dioxygenase